MITEIRDPDLARQHLLQGLWTARAAQIDEQTVAAVLQWAFEIAGAGHPLPLLGFVADVGHVALGSLHGVGAEQPRAVPRGLNSALLRKYEDYLLGKLYSDLSFERGADALLRFQGRDRVKGLAFLIQQFQRRADLPGVQITPGVLKTLATHKPEELLAESWAHLDEVGVSDSLVAELEQLIDAVRNTGDVLASEDVFELEHGTALAEFGQRLALRQVLQAARQLEEQLPHQRPRPLVRRQQVATHVLDEDTYPVGGYTSISTRGSVESLLQSQLSYMEVDERPDLFDIKFLRDELLYYSRDENQFFRRRQTFVIALYPDLITARIKDSGLPWQRIVLLLGLLVTLVRKLISWLSDDALTFEFLLLGHEGDAQLEDERTLLEMLLREEIAGGTVVVENVALPELVTRRCDEHARWSLCRLLAVSQEGRRHDCQFAATARLKIAAALPALSLDDEAWQPHEEQGMDGWHETLQTLLRAWV